LPDCGSLLAVDLGLKTGRFEIEALVSLLERKGVLTMQELLEEIRQEKP